MARLTSAPMRSRSTAAVESRSSHRPIGSAVSFARLRAKARVDCARGPSDSIHVDRQAKYETRRAPLRGKCEQCLGVGLEGLACDGGDAGGEPPVGIARRDADGLGAEVEADQRAARGQQWGNLGKRQNRHPEMASTLIQRDAATILAHIPAKRTFSCRSPGMAIRHSGSTSAATRC